ncbi:Xaa-Pro peptidase family protein [Bacteroides sp.]|uniref:M24 family metallopeptidase n=1 Tax=Bacteroides sp. TaxID=29523 RepID=UPI0026293E01|nr:Xaa-Pro peptidase family protein [Bacteroides sp.]MDD3038362.1 Xaa-Pro peptidase family protein [Bacteroides sp.]
MLQPELKLRRDKIRSLMAQQGIEAALITCNANLIYTYGCVVSGYLYLPLHSPALLFFKRPNNITGEHSFPIRKPEQIIELLKEQGLPIPSKLMLEGDELPYTEYVRLASLFPDSEVVNGTPIIRQARSIKTSIEIEMLRLSGVAHTKAYEQIPNIYRPGMTDIEFSIEIERLMRLQGNLGFFRVFGRSMEIFMGSVLTSDNAGYPSPYDFALGGKGLDPALPGGANKTPLKEGQSVMVDLGGNFNGYMGDMSRVFSIGKLSEEAYTAHQVCLEIQEKISSIARPGVVCEHLYNTAVEIATKAGFADKFMGTDQQAKFIGHGIGLEINEAPVLAPRMKQELETGMVFALEPKIVIPGVGPVGIENTWVVANDGIEKLTNCNEDIIDLEAFYKEKETL